MPHSHLRQRPTAERRALATRPEPAAAIAGHRGPIGRTRAALAASHSHNNTLRRDVRGLLQQMAASGIPRDVIMTALGSRPGHERAMCCRCSLPCDYYIVLGVVDEWSSPVCYPCGLHVSAHPREQGQPQRRPRARPGMEHRAQHG